MGNQSACKCCAPKEEELLLNTLQNVPSTPKNNSELLKMKLDSPDKSSDLPATADVKIPNLKENNEMAKEPEKVKEDPEPGAALKIQTKFRQSQARKKIPHALFEKIKRDKESENRNLRLDEMELDLFKQKINENSNIEEIKKKYNDQLNEIKYYGTEKVYQLNPIILVDRRENTVEYNLAQWTMKGDICGKVQSLSADGSYYEGLIQNNLFEGKGLFIQPDGSYYFGDWSKGLCEGKGILNINGHSCYEGPFVNNMKNGAGIEEYSDGSKYDGDFVDNEKEGIGKYTFQDGSYYEGSFKNSKFNGTGTYEWADGRKYTGDFKDGAMHGQGKHIWKDGEYYEGFYNNNKKCGQGEFTWPNGNKFFGTFVNNMPNGEATLKEHDTGAIYVIIFRYGKIISSRIISGKNSAVDENNHNKYLEGQLSFQDEEL